MEQSENKNNLPLLQKIFQEYNDGFFDISLSLSLFSLYLKMKRGNDNVVQQFEIGFCRDRAYKLKNLDDIIAEIKNEKNEKWFIFKDAFEVLRHNFQDCQEHSKSSEEIGVVCLKIDAELKNIFGKYNASLQPETQVAVQLNFDDFEKEFDFRLTPTSGIRMLNNNPYEFFLRKVLNISSLNEWENAIESKLYGTLIHKIMENFAKVCRHEWITMDKINSVLFKKSCDYVLQTFGIKIDDFLNFKIERVGDIAVKLEKNAFAKNRFVEVEKRVSYVLNGIKIEAIIDRLEIDKIGKKMYIYDFKTGAPPTSAEEISGLKTQLLIIAFILSKLEEYKNFSVEKMSYVDLSGKEIKRNSFVDTDEIVRIEAKLTSLIERYFAITNGKILPVNEKMYFIRSSFSGLYESDKEILRFARSAFA